MTPPRSWPRRLIPWTPPSIASDPDDVSERSRSVYGQLADRHLRGGNDRTDHRNSDQVQPTADQGSGEMTVHPDAVAPPIAVQPAPPAAPQQVP